MIAETKRCLRDTDIPVHLAFFPAMPCLARAAAGRSAGAQRFDYRRPLQPAPAEHIVSYKLSLYANIGHWYYPMRLLSFCV